MNKIIDVLKENATDDFTCECGQQSDQGFTPVNKLGVQLDDFGADGGDWYAQCDKCDQIYRMATAGEKEYTILMLYPDYIASQYGEETYLAYVKAETVVKAIVKAQDEAAQVNELSPIGSPIDFAVLFACLGHHENLYTEK